MEVGITASLSTTTFNGLFLQGKVFRFLWIWSDDAAAELSKRGLQILSQRV